MKNYILIALITISNIGFAQKKNSFLDERDGKVYKTVEIGNQVWMAQNLNYKIRGAWCYENNEDNCNKYGLIYTWSAVMNGSFNEKAQGICPKGWHIPSNEEWIILVNEHKKSKDLWEGSVSGFDMLFGGCRFPDGSFDFIDQVATFWTSTIDEYNDKFVYTRYAYKDNKSAPIAGYSTNQDYGQYLRCIKD